jgi:rubrerythrin
MGIKKGIKKYKFGGYSSMKSRWSNSSFWLDLDDDDSKKLSLDVVKLAGYKRAVANFVHIVTGKSDISVKYSEGDSSYTDGSTVTLSSKLSDGASFDTTVGLALHEGSHCLLTDFNIVAKYQNQILPVKYTYSDIVHVKDICNVIEDRRIDNFIYKSAPGYRGYYKALYDEYFYAESISIALKRKMKSEVTLENYMFHIINIVNPDRDRNALPGLSEIYDMININTIDRLKSVSDSYELAMNVYDKIVSIIGNQPDQQQQSQNNSSSGSEGSSGNGSKESKEEDGSGEPTKDNLTPKEKKSKERAEKQAKALQEKEDRKVAKSLSKDIRKQVDFIRGQIKKSKLSRRQSQQIETLSDNQTDIVDVPVTNSRYGNVNNIQTLVIKGITAAIIESGIVSCHYNRRGSDPNTKAVEDGLRLGTMLGKKLKTRDENRSLKTTRCTAGQIDRRLIAELGFGAENVFNQVIHYTVKPIYVHLSIDASGSMSGDKWQKAIKSAVAIAKACSMVSNIHVEISLRGGTHGLQTDMPLNWVVYNSKINSMNHIMKYFNKLDCNSSTPESLCYDAISKHIIKASNGKESYFITYSDGEPCWYNSGAGFSGETAKEHCKLQLNKFKKNSINILAYFIHNYSESRYVDSAFESFKQTYGKDAAMVNVDTLNELGRSINSLFERKYI